MKRVLLIGLCLSLVLSFSACGGKQEEDTDLQKVTVVLDYVPNTNHTGIYVAKDEGYYKDEGLDVEIIEPADNTVTSLIAADKGDFGISFQEDVTYAKALEEPVPVKAIAAIIQHNTSGFAAYEGKGITSPKDFENKTYAGWGSPSEESVIKAVMEADGGDFSTVQITTASDSFGYPLLKDEIDFMWFFWAWDGIAAEREGVELNYMPLSDFDERLDYYTPVIIAKDDQDEELSRKFLAATGKGYEYCVDDPEGAAEILYNNAEEYDLDMLIESQKYLADKYIDDAESWGLMKDEVWDRYTEFMMEYGLIDKSIEADELYTNEYLK